MRNKWNPALPMSEHNRPAHALGLGRRDYYRFLRIVYDMTASEAWAKAQITPPTVEELRAAIQKPAMRL